MSRVIHSSKYVSGIHTLSPRNSCKTASVSRNTASLASRSGINSSSNSATCASAAAILQALYSGGEQWYLVGEILGEAALFVEAYDERAVVAGTDNVLQKSGGCVFFESKAT